ncbi:hypothetical protein LCGC14_0258780 [marine sediment metagenome]|uniref:Uncharacterized protein n=1 Tax=marine sediment metagenome TaxID=412755 RepID=A0A0F9X772_9ZZZZ
MTVTINITLKGKWFDATAITAKMTKRAPRAMDMAVHGAALSYRRRVVKAFVAQGGGGKKWDSLGIITLALRKNAAMIGKSAAGGTKALIRSGDMRKSVTVQRAGKAHYFVGVHRTHGKYNIARVHEQPGSKSGVFKIKVSDKMRRYFLYLYIKGAIPAPLKATTTHVVVKRRSFLESVWMAEKDDIAKVAEKRYWAVLTTGKVGAGRVR